MSTQYNTEPPATATATLHTTLGPIHISLFGTQTPLTTRNFLQHVADNYYTGTIFHRIVPGFVIQGGDPTGTGAGGTSIYEEPEFETDPDARDPTEKIVLRDELHSRLRFNRRGLVGMAKSEDGTYGSQFFITLANTERELNGQCTLFGRVEGDSIFTVLKIAEAEVVEGTERPVYPVKVTGCEVGELGKFAGKVVLDRRRQGLASSDAIAAEKKDKGAAAAGAGGGKKKSKKPKKTLLSFAGGDGDEDAEEEEMPARPKYNAALVTDLSSPSTKKKHEPESTSAHNKRPPPHSSPPKAPAADTTTTTHKIIPDPSTQLPLPDPESPARSPSPEVSASTSTAAPKKSRLDRTNAEIESVMASMRRTIPSNTTDTTHKKSALEAMIPASAIRGRRRPPPGNSSSSTTTMTGSGSGSGSGLTGFSSSTDAQALKMFNAFKAKLENADAVTTTTNNHNHKNPSSTAKRNPNPTTSSSREEDQEEDEEAQLCDLHFIANCQSCQSWNEQPDDAAFNSNAAAAADGADNDRGWLTHQLRFGKDTLGKDLKWKQEHSDDVDSLMVIDPREKEREISGKSGKRRGLERERERERKRGRVGDLEWERERRRTYVSELEKKDDLDVYYKSVVTVYIHHVNSILYY
ncbi:putative peptidyl-prolyl cis-trans isomerase [Aspergillus homomorphus CBS 101889]|uniref:Peptidyl-prolyl isomerase CWC27 n=1 Tax=Aspergillus homomorphus (strain CBS 101889) TaxID=1450537 RepID=A0A395HTK4_ASPHC|nr:hypothetical protein BO97DRAFT_478737 [Aspergillus homomorphus CBS 101889]RAL11147.1 hypothetical protein BO97DRAFT_478737 [Aspergillus homomorphus CBS 101889]